MVHVFHQRPPLSSASSDEFFTSPGSLFSERKDRSMAKNQPQAPGTGGPDRVYAFGTAEIHGTTRFEP
jgi:hypothetical protein